MKDVFKFLAAMSLGGFLLAGCASQPTAESTPEDAAGAEAGQSGAEAGGLGSAEPLGADPLDDPASPLAQRVIYFEFDSSDIQRQFLDVLSAHAQYLVEHPEVSVRLEGHADERGSREYNIGLGDRRAQAVRRILLFQGVSADQVETVSYGEERPAVEGHNEEAWAQNRRVEIVYIR